MRNVVPVGVIGSTVNEVLIGPKRINSLAVSHGDILLCVVEVGCEIPSEVSSPLANPLVGGGVLLDIPRDLVVVCEHILNGVCNESKSRDISAS